MTTQKTTKPATVADFVEENAEIIFTVFDGGKIGLNQDSVPYIRELLITLFKTPHKTVTRSRSAVGVSAISEAVFLARVIGVRHALTMQIGSKRAS